MSRPCVIYVANRGFALAGSRLPLIRTFLEQDWRVIVATAADEYAHALEKEGAELEEVKFSRGGMGFFADLAAYNRLKKIYERYCPRLIHHFHAKPVILGSLAARHLPEQEVSVVNTITGLGYAFSRNGVNRWIAGRGYKLAMPFSTVTIFQNSDDRQLFLDNGWLDKRLTRLIISSGVNIDRYRQVERKRPRNPITILMVARLLWQKGIREYVEAARLVKSRFPDCRFQLAGEVDALHPDAVTEHDLEKINADAAIDFLGFLPKIEDALMKADIFVYPSYYREGVPRVVLEASACGLPTIAADVPGTREAVIGNKTGYLVKPENMDALVDGISKLVENAELREKMGKQARKMAKERFDINVIVDEQLDVYRSIGVNIQGGND